jgi:FixJ family two-component response regulator
LVEDDAAVRAALTFSLEIEGFRVRAFESGEALLREAELPPCCCLVLDQRLPGLDGLALFEQLRRCGVDAPALLITTNPTERMRGRAQSAGMEILEKPLIGDSLIRAVDRISGRLCARACQRRAAF